MDPRDPATPQFASDNNAGLAPEAFAALAEANRAIIDGYSDIAKRQYEMLKGLLRELRKVRGDRDAVVRELKRVIERAKKDMQVLQKIASRTNSKAQGIVKRRAEANIKAWRKLVAEARLMSAKRDI